MIPSAPVTVLIVQESDVHGAADLGTLLAHFSQRSVSVSADRYRSRQIRSYRTIFYLAGRRGSPARAKVASDLPSYPGTMVWVGPGVEVLGDDRLTELGLRLLEALGGPPGALSSTITYRGQGHADSLPVPLLSEMAPSRALARSDRGPFIAGAGKLWYAAAPPDLSRAHFWSACVWADALHEILAQPHAQERSLITTLQGVPVWADEARAPNAVRPMRAAGIPVTLLATTKFGDVALGDRPHAVEGLRRAEALGATIALSSQEPVEAQEQLHLAWEVGLHPVAWQGPWRGTNPFHFRFATAEASPPYDAGGLLPSPITITDAGYIAPEDLQRLAMQGVVRDAVATLSFGLWATPSRFAEFVHSRQSNGWRLRDLRTLGVEISDSRRAVTSHRLTVRTTARRPYELTTWTRDWALGATTRVTPSTSFDLDPPTGGMAALAPVPDQERRALTTAVTLDPWAYSRAGTTSEQLATALAERYQQNGVNAVFCYAYNVEAGAAYRTRYSGATLSEWGEDDLLGHLLEACHARGIKVIAWLYSGRDRGMWSRHSDWRERTADGKDYNPLRLHAAYFLCPRNPDVRRWYAGLLRDLTERYPTLDGVELCEPLVNWYGTTACYCDTCRRDFTRACPGQPLGGEAWRGFRAQGLTEFLSGCLKEVSGQGIETYVMTICDALDNGAILTPHRQWEESAFDLDALLASPGAPDWVNFEIIWQQWAVISRYGTDVFNPDWAAQTAQRLSRRVDGRARVMIHLELTDFGLQLMTPEKLAETIHKVDSAHPDGVECYHSAAFDRKSAWPSLSRAYQEIRR